MANILIIDDDPGMVQVISDLCTHAGHTITALNSGNRGLEAMRGLSPDLIVTDLRMEGVTGLDILREAHQSVPKTPVILVTASKSAEIAVQAMQAGASDYILKPFKVDHLMSAIHRSIQPTILDSGRACHPNTPLTHSPKQLRASQIIGRSARMREIFELVDKIAASDSTILITGESGTGKELIARALHLKSHRRDNPFVAINCSALPENLLESELFGHKKGSFTGAVQDKIGLFEEAEGGTIFLDEINSMAPLLQTKLLRVLQERTLRRVGDNHVIPIHVRVLAASNEPLHEKIKTGAFRQDLYYRLAVIPVEMPPLRARQDDIPLLVEHFLAKHGPSQRGDNVLKIEPSAIQALCSHRWPGNVRELENAIERACVLCENGVVRRQDLPPHIVQPFSLKLENAECDESEAMKSLNAVPLPVGLSLDDFISILERRFIEETIRFNQGSRDRAALMLEISTATLYRKIEHEKRAAKARARNPA